MTDIGGDLDALGLALLSLTQAEKRTPCQASPHRHRWTSEDLEERDWAARHCAPCPITDACAQSAAEHRDQFGVWGGRDLTPGSRRRKAS